MSKENNMTWTSTTIESDQDEALVVEDNGHSDGDNDSASFGCPDQLYVRGQWMAAVENSGADSNTVPSSKLFWKVEDPVKCRLEQWNRETFCKYLEGRNIVIVGDSINLQWFEFMHTLLAPSNHTIRVHQRQNIGKPSFIPIVHASTSICVNNSSASRLTFVRNDYLKARQELDAQVTSAFINIPWSHLLEPHDEKDILILNTGAHARRPVAEYQRGLQELKSSLLDEIQYRGTILLRTTPRGHINCSLMDKPIAKEHDEDWNRYFSDDSEVYKKYRYERFLPYINVLKSTFRDVTTATILDVAPMTELRPDGHLNPPKDCLHYNMSDVYFEWTQLAFNALRGRL